MDSRIPLSVVLAAEERRHAIPHCTFRVSLPQVDEVPTAEQQEGLDFFRYLDSNDTRLPSHPLLRAYAQPAEEYETYVGEEVWETNAKEGKDGADSASDDERLPPVPAFPSVIGWISRVMDEEEWARDGVVLCGRCVVADDGSWVVPSRSPTLFATREVLLLMRNSCKFLRDVHAQVVASLLGKEGHRARPAALTCLEFTLAKSLAGSGASEMRAILPYPIHFSPATQTWVTEDTAASLSFAGIGQRLTDACFPSLMAWTEEEHDAHFRVMRRRVEQAALLERVREVDADFISRQVERFLSSAAQRRRTASVGDDARHGATRLTLLLTVDLLFDAPSLPIYVLSAKARVFELVQRTDEAWEGLLGAATAASWPLWTPLLKAAEGRSGAAETDEVQSAAAQPSAEQHCGAADESSCDTEGDDDDGDDLEGDNAAAASLNFFRMFRDVEHWNAYVVAMVRRLHDAAGGAASSPELNKPSRDVRHYCVVATEAGDLVTCSDTLEKRGLPLELLHPELLEQNEEATAFLKMLREGLLKKANGGGGVGGV